MTPCMVYLPDTMANLPDAMLGLPNTMIDLPVTLVDLPDYMFLDATIKTDVSLGTGYSLPPYLPTYLKALSS